MADHSKKEEIKSYFNAGDIPTESHFRELIESGVCNASIIDKGVLDSARLGIDVNLKDNAGSGEISRLETHQVNTSFLVFKKSDLNTNYSVQIELDSGRVVDLLSFDESDNSVSIPVYDSETQSYSLKEVVEKDWAKDEFLSKNSDVIKLDGASSKKATIQVELDKDNILDLLSFDKRNNFVSVPVYDGDANKFLQEEVAVKSWVKNIGADDDEDSLSNYYTKAKADEVFISANSNSIKLDGSATKKASIKVELDKNNIFDLLSFDESDHFVSIPVYDSEAQSYSLKEVAEKVWAKEEFLSKNSDVIKLDGASSKKATIQVELDKDNILDLLSFDKRNNFVSVPVYDGDANKFLQEEVAVKSWVKNMGADDDEDSLSNYYTKAKADEVFISANSNSIKLDGSATKKASITVELDKNNIFDLLSFDESDHFVSIPVYDGETQSYSPKEVAEKDWVNQLITELTARINVLENVYFHNILQNEETIDILPRQKNLIPIYKILEGGDESSFKLVDVRNSVGGQVSIAGSDIEFVSTDNNDPASFQYTVRNQEGWIKHYIIHLNVVQIPDPNIGIEDL